MRAKGATVLALCLAVASLALGGCSYPWGCTPTWFRSCGGERELRTAGLMELPQRLDAAPARAGTFQIYLHTSRFTYWFDEEGMHVYVENAPVGKLIIQARVVEGTQATVQGFSPWEVKQAGPLRAVVKPYPRHTFGPETKPAFLFEGVIR